MARTLNLRIIKNQIKKINLSIQRISITKKSISWILIHEKNLVSF